MNVLERWERIRSFDPDAVAPSGGKVRRLRAE
jgi:hypothetical protein